MYDINDENYFEISVAQHSILGREMLGDIENGNVPENLFGIELVKPEVLSVNNFNGEDITSPWGIGKYHTSDYVNTLTPTLS